MMKPVFTALHKSIKGTRKNQCCRRIVTEKNNLSVQDLHCCTIWPFRCLILRKRRIPGFICQLFQHTTVKNTIYSIFVQTVFYILQKLLLNQILHIENLQHGFGSDTCRFFLNLHSAVPDSFSDQRGICFYRVRKSFFGTSQNFFRFHF